MSSSSPSSSSFLDDVFELLTLATHLEESGHSRIEAATKYYEAVYLMRRYAERLPRGVDEENDATRQLLREKCRHYESLASKLMAAESCRGGGGGPAAASGAASPSSSAAAVASHHPLSPVDKETYFHQDSSVVPIRPPPPPPPAAASASVNTKASQANAKLAAALDRDESGRTESAVSAYMEAAELYLQALQISERQQQQSSSGASGGGAGTGTGALQHGQEVMKRRLEQTLDRVEQLKEQQQSRGTRKGQGQKQQQQQQQRQTNNSNNSSSKNGKNRSPLRSGGDRQRSRSPAPPGGAVVGKDKDEGGGGSGRRGSSISSSTLTADEVSILKRSSLIASGLFLPWSDEDAAALARSCAAGARTAPKMFTDPDGFLALSDKQKERFHRWARPAEIARMRRGGGGGGNGLVPRGRGGAANRRRQREIVMVKSITPYSIRQQYVTDCSFVASLCICAAFERRFRKRLVTGLLHPHDGTGRPLYNAATGRYMVKLWLNGVARAVTIDDYLPVDRHGNLLCSHSSSAGSESEESSSPAVLELWVCLVEKAYMKLCGGYDFPGSNSGVDLFSLTGWIPERILFASDAANVRDFETAPDRCWERIESASSFGDCLITVSCHLDNLTKSEADAVGLVTGHAYAVLAVVRTGAGLRLLQLKNPWAHRGWKGRYSRYDGTNWTAELRSELGYDPAAAAAREDDGVFWISWDDILRYFRNFHLSWNPALFRYRRTAHGAWPKDLGPADDTFNVGDNPQYVLSLSDEAVKSGATVWILVSRHVTKQEQEGQEATDFLTVHLHRNRGNRERIWYSGRQGGCILTGAYTNNPHVLVRYDVQGPEDRQLSLVLSQYKKSRDLAYTVSCYCTENFALGVPLSELPHRMDFSSAWTENTAGGPLGLQSFFSNPTFAVRVGSGGGDGGGRDGGGRGEASAVTIQVRLSTRKTVAGHVILVRVPSFGAAADRAPAAGEPAVDSGKYRHGFVATDRRGVPPGCYALVVSNFHRGETAPFFLRVASSEPLRMEQIR